MAPYSMVRLDELRPTLDALELCQGAHMLVAPIEPLRAQRGAQAAQRSTVGIHETVHDRLQQGHWFGCLAANRPKKT